MGVGIDLATGVTQGGVCRNRSVSTHPDTGRAIGGIAIPFWPRILSAAAALSEAVEMGYVGVDLVLDAEHGPMVLEANARPGLALQIANRQGLAPLLAAAARW